MKKYVADVGASVVVFLIAVPLSIGIALASGIPVERAAGIGLLAAAIGGIVVGALGGSPLQVSGPAAGLAVLVGTMIQEIGLPGMWMSTFLAGLLQMGAGLARIGRLFRAISPALIEGMLSGIGILIFAAQAHILLGRTPPGSGEEFGGLLNLLELPLHLWESLRSPSHQAAAGIGFITLAVLILWEKKAPKALRLIPAALVAVIVATALSELLSLSVTRISVPSTLWESLSFPTEWNWAHLGRRSVWLSALTLAFVASVEAVLSATALDTLQSHAPRTRHDWVLIGEGAGNVLCGLLGLLPVSGVIVRSSANIQAGAQTRLSVILHGVWIVGVLAAFPDILRYLPLPALAALLVYTGVRLVAYRELLRLWRIDRSEALLFLLTMGTIIATDLFIGIMVGILGAFFSTLHRLSHLEVEVRPLAAENQVQVSLIGAATFLRLPLLAERLERLPASAVVHFHLDRLSHIDHASMQYLQQWAEQYKQKGGRVIGLSAFRLRRKHRAFRRSL